MKVRTFLCTDEHGTSVCNDNNWFILGISNSNNMDKIRMNNELLDEGCCGQKKMN